MINCTFENGNKAKLRHVVVDSIAVKNNKILLVKRGPNHVSPGKYGVPGGFVELNETTKDAALRELKEETGYEGKITRLVAVIDDPNRKNEDRQNISFIYEIEEKIRFKIFLTNLIEFPTLSICLSCVLSIIK